MLINIGILILLDMICAVFSATEIAVSSVNRTKLKMLAEEGNKKAKRLLVIIEKPTIFFATTQFYITSVSLFYGMYAANVFTQPLLNLFSTLGLPVSEAIAEPLVFIIITIVLTYFSLISAELVPKQLALKNSLKFSLFMVDFLNVTSKIALPFVKLLSITANLVLKMFRIKSGNLGEEITKEEILMMVEAGSEQGSIAERELDMVGNVLELRDKTVNEIYVHRLDVVALPVEASFDEIITSMANSKFARIPIFQESIDNIIGIVHLKDLVKYMVDNSDRSGFDVKDFLLEPFFIPYFKKTDELFREMQKKRIHMAIVLDEHGGTMGIVTSEDLVEEVVGNIQDEHDFDEEQEITPVDENTYIVQGIADLKKLEWQFDVNFPTDEYETLSGFLIGRFGGIPAENENPQLEHNGLLFQVESVFEKRIGQVRVSVLKKEDNKAEEGRG